MEKDLRPYLAHIFINFSKRSVKLVDDEGYEQNVIFKFDEEGAEGFAETVDLLKQVIPYGVEITYIVEEAVIQ